MRGAVVSSIPSQCDPVPADDGPLEGYLGTIYQARPVSPFAALAAGLKQAAGNQRLTPRAHSLMSRRFPAANGTKVHPFTSIILLFHRPCNGDTGGSMPSTPP